ncbi:hypothetical protein [Prosthecobacter dejongeii]|uniref:O-antigen/teichoic acid export membrane protein n=1 Tax=Prosthecobacter dejongeii TaxID=48465 RepID=A0A7W7YHN0_9BACT|nr:hypothetical protein [Prosthecobacter dejongeii]MBB5036383.1 O-antigen/teichoic acid export membrane protein [Prosthecobacter dejongeii]
MNPKGIHFQFQGKRGLPAVLPLIFMAIVAIGLIALFVFVGLAIAAVGLGVSACAALYYAVRRKLTSTSYRSSPLNDQAHRENPPHDVKVIEVEAVRVERE